MAAKVSVHIDECCRAAYPRNGPANVTIKMQDGAQYSLYVPEPLGSPDLPMSDEMLMEKFRLSLHGHPASASACALAAALYSPQPPTVRTIIQVLAL